MEEKYIISVLLIAVCVLIFVCVKYDEELDVHKKKMQDSDLLVMQLRQRLSITKSNLHNDVRQVKPRKEKKETGTCKQCGAITYDYSCSYCGAEYKSQQKKELGLSHLHDVSSWLF